MRSTASLRIVKYVEEKCNEEAKAINQRPKRMPYGAPFKAGGLVSGGGNGVLLQDHQQADGSHEDG